MLNTFIKLFTFYVNYAIMFEQDTFIISLESLGTPVLWYFTKAQTERFGLSPIFIKVLLW